MNFIPPPIYAAVTLIGMWQLHKHYPVICTDAGWPVLAGWLVIAAGLAIDLLSILSFNKADTTVNPLRPERTSALVTSGLYAVTRNPMYLGMAFMLIGAGMVMRCLTPMVLPLVFCLVVTLVQIMPEEKKLHELFGDDYKRYCGSVGRWL